MTVFHATSDAAFAEFESKNNGKVIFVDFFATWCKPCKQMAPLFEEEAAKAERQGIANAVFVSADVEVCENTAAKYEINSLPTFMAIKKNGVIAIMEGASKTGLPKFVSKNIHA